ncbi:histidine phosphatase family protein [Paraflavitalea sp. CAU 1676]|uniref:SixA phosphatase family protein n=1 Tax=Paraflavitalea sp. CAU 1676 TaxID=3032598 RepID=UPI0023DB81BC|nr:histidine phosphatase family protein [Paraflavitalea sp. CAU 1676]MDF2186885.1 histidine phosphatase family protein [Paraflavitalea sp. CAU 1676]
MKHVLLIRHAKSSWGDPGLPDFDRPLNERGKNDAPQMAQRLLARSIDIDSFISSPAKRARKTASLFATEYKVNKEDILLVPELYHASPVNFFEAILKAPEAANTIAVFSHNPGITEFVNMLTEVRIDDMPTCAIFGVQVDAQQWSQFKEAPKTFWFFDYPKSFSV